MSDSGRLCFCIASVLAIAFTSGGMPLSWGVAELRPVSIVLRRHKNRRLVPYNCREPALLHGQASEGGGTILSGK